MKNLRNITVLILTVLGLALFLPQTTLAGVDDFYFDSMEVDYYLSKDAEGRSTLTVKETLAAVFPDYNQNRGIVRSIPLTYNNHSVDFKLKKVLRNGKVANIYKDTEKNGYRILTIRDKSDSAYLHGLNTYEITYTLRDVTLKPADSDGNEFYWDVNGTGWNQPFSRVVARLYLDKSIREQFDSSKITCFTGKYGSSEQNCTSEISADGAILTFATTEQLKAGANLSIVVGFAPDTFADYVPATWKPIAAIISLVVAIPAAILTIRAWLIRRRLMKNSKPTTFPVEYIPPKDADIFESALMHRNFLPIPSAFATAGLISLAVNHKIKITEKSKKTIFSGAKYELEIIKDDFSSHENSFFRAIFKDQIIVGGKFKLEDVDDRSGDRLFSFAKKVIKDLDRFLDKPGKKAALKAFNRMAWPGFLLTAVGFGLGWLVRDDRFHQNFAEVVRGSNLSSIMFIQVVLAAITIFQSSIIGAWHKLNDNGMRLQAYLMGLKKYIAMAETERLAFNQSVKGAQLDGQNRVKLYEKLLPFAIIFGLEKSWTEVLKVNYEQSQTEPDWYMGGFALGSFASSLGNFTHTVSTSKVHSTSSSSSGFGGGGFSGGGGGGGGGGGC